MLGSMIREFVRERIHGEVNPSLGNSSGQDSNCDKMGEGARSRICQVVSRDVDGLDIRDGALLGGDDPFLHVAHVGGEGGLAPHGGGDSAQKGRHLGPTLSFFKRTNTSSVLVGSISRLK